MAGSTIKSLKMAQNTIANLRAGMLNYSNHIDDVHQRLTEFMRGDGNNAYWQGAAAYAWCEKAIGGKGFKSVCRNYNNSFIEFKDYAKKIEKAVIKNKSAGMSKASVRSRLQNCNGSTYTSGIPSDKTDKIIPNVLDTVKQDAVNDDQNAASTRAYNNLESALKTLTNDLSKLKGYWDEVVQNTTGEMNKDARGRSSGTQRREDQIHQLISELNNQYIGDMLISESGGGSSSNYSSSSGTSSSSQTSFGNGKIYEEMQEIKPNSNAARTNTSSTSSNDSPPQPNVEAWPDRQPSSPIIESNDGWESGELHLF